MHASSANGLVAGVTDRSGEVEGTYPAGNMKITGVYHTYINHLRWHHIFQQARKHASNQYHHCSKESPQTSYIMQFTTLALPLITFLSFATAAPSEVMGRSPAPVSNLIQYPADHSVEMIKRAHMEARCNIGCPCNWCGMTICCECNC